MQQTFHTGHPWGLYWRDKNQRNRKREMDRKVSTSPRRETFSWWRCSQFKSSAATTGNIQSLKFVGGCALDCWRLDKQMPKSVHWPQEQPILRCSEVTWTWTAQKLEHSLCLQGHYRLYEASAVPAALIPPFPSLALFHGLANQEGNHRFLACWPWKTP